MKSADLDAHDGGLLLCDDEVVMLCDVVAAGALDLRDNSVVLSPELARAWAVSQERPALDALESLVRALLRSRCRGPRLDAALEAARGVLAAAGREEPR